MREIIGDFLALTPIDPNQIAEALERNQLTANALERNGLTATIEFNGKLIVLGCESPGDCEVIRSASRLIGATMNWFSGPWWLSCTRELTANVAEKWQLPKQSARWSSRWQGMPGLID